MVYAGSLIQHFETYLRVTGDLNEDDSQLIAKKYNSHFVTHEITLGIYSIKDFSDAVYPLGDHKVTLPIEYDVFSMKTKVFLTRFGSTFGVLGFDENFFCNTLIGFTNYCDYKATNAIHADSLGV